MGKRRKTGKKTLIFRPYITHGIGMGAKVKIADNSGAKEGKLIGVMHTSTRLNRYPSATVGDVVTLSIRKGTPEMRRQKLTAIIVRQKQFIHRPDGSRIQFEDNAAVIVTPEGEPKGSEIRGPIAKEATDLHPRLAGVASIII